MSQNPIRVLCVFSSLDRGGAESMCMNLYRKIDRSKVQFDFVKHTHEKGAFEEEITSLGGRIYEAPRYKIYNYPKYRRWWVKHLSSHPEHRIIHGHFFGISAVYFQIAKQYNRITVGHSHCTPQNSKTIKGVLKQLHINRIERYADYCFACGSDAGKWIYPHRKFKVLNNSIDTAKFRIDETIRAPKREELHLSDKLVVGHIGRFFEQKNHSFIVRVFDEIYKKNKSAVLLLVGDGELKPEIEQQVREYGLLNAVIFTGVREDVSDLIQAMDVFVLPSLFEGLPVVGIEAQAAGLKCFLSNNVTKEVNITGRCEFLPIDDPKLWADKILSADLTKVDTSEQIKAAGYDIHTTAKQLQRFYLKISERSGSAKKSL